MIKKIIFFFLITFFAYSIHSSVNADGNGTNSNPYTVSNAAELKSALNNGGDLSSLDTLYVKLTNNILYTASDSFKIQSNVVVDGNGYAMQYTGSDYVTGTAGYYLTKSGYHVTYNNLIFGSSNYQFGQTYYGILLGGSNQVNLTINNVTYYGKNGAQPLCNYNVGTVVTMTGTNNFSSIAGGSSGQEFMEGANLVFGSDSTTNITQNTTDASALLWNSGGGSTFNMSLQKNAKVNIQTSKPYFSYGKPLNIDIADSAQLNITNTAYDVTMAQSGGSTINMAKNASFNASGNGKFGNQASGIATTFNTSDPSKIGFENTSTASGTFASSPKIVPAPTMTAYSLDSYVGSNKTTQDASANSFNLTDSLFQSNTKKVVYYPKVVPESPEPTTLNWNDNKIFGDVASQFNYFAKTIDAKDNHKIYGNYATQNLLSNADAVRSDGVGNSYIQKSLNVVNANMQNGTSFMFGGTGNLILGNSMTFSDQSVLTSDNKQYKITRSPYTDGPLSIDKVRQDMDYPRFLAQRL